MTILIVLYIVGCIITFLTIFYTETKDKDEIILSELLLFLIVSIGSWAFLAFWLIDEYKIFKKIGKKLNETKIPLKRKVQK